MFWSKNKTILQESVTVEWFDLVGNRRRFNVEQDTSAMWTFKNKPQVFKPPV